MLGDIPKLDLSVELEVTLIMERGNGNIEVYF